MTHIGLISDTHMPKRWKSLPQDAREHALDSARHRRTLGQQLESGLIRRALIAWLHEVPGVGTHDPDGHLIILGKNFPSRSATVRQRKNRRRP